ncbi:hypothetical protein [Companilactobacillus zhongbaensis]|uniref:hypothetical protein n=1 Tax=Companilactobacillus zhongbaensis TaxID=2486009 RepID=UPI000F767413|nr:hypothetical protein [Companilactobacillus zhongbaensis]
MNAKKRLRWVLRGLFFLCGLFYIPDGSFGSVLNFFGSSFLGLLPVNFFGDYWVWLFVTKPWYFGYQTFFDLLPKLGILVTKRFLICCQTSVLWLPNVARFIAETSSGR